MPKFSKRSLESLSECHMDLQMIAHEAIKGFDFTVYTGYRSPEEQYQLFRIGRDLPGAKVTDKDGFKSKSKHNLNPSLAFDCAPYPIDWNNEARFIALAWYIKGIADKLYEEGKITRKVRLGADWDGNNNPADNWKDLPHIELI